MNLKFVVDSTFGLEEEFIKENDIRVVPLNVIIDGKSYRDGIDIDLKEVMESFEKGSKVSTSQPSPDTFHQKFLDLKNEGVTDIICMTISSTLSGTYSSALLGSEEVKGVNIYFFDTLSASIGSEMLLIEAVKEFKKGKTIKEVLDHLEELKRNSVILLNMEDLTALKKSGRITRIKAAIGNLVRVKPILEYIDGKLSVITKFRTEKAITSYIIERLQKEYQKVSSKLIVYVSHVYAQTRINRLKETIESVFKNIKVHLSKQITPVVAINIGYGGIGISWCYE